VTKYSGIATNSQDVADLKTINQYLNTLEAQVAQEFVNIGDIDYLDRMNTDALFRELHLSQSAAFNASSGALKGLLGRLDFLVVIDSAEPTTARVRLIDVESGAVRAVEACKRKSSFLGLGQDGPPDCLRPFISRAKDAAHVKMRAKVERARQQSIQAQAAKEQAATNQQAAKERAAKDQEAARVQAEAMARDRERAQQLAQERAEAQAREQAEVDAKVSALRPDLDDAIARLSAANGFWEELSKQLASSGQSLRSTIRATLNSANLDGKRCQELLSRRNTDDAKPCILKLNSDLDKLDGLK
jgi:flagellar biosynthesis GTPase FlhF